MVGQDELGYIRYHLHYTNNLSMKCGVIDHGEFDRIKLNVLACQPVFPELKRTEGTTYNLCYVEGGRAE